MSLTAHNGFRASGLQGFRASGLQGFRASGLQGFRASGRDSVADSLRGLAIILVVVGHVIGGFKRSELTFAGSDFLQSYIYSFHMPLMFMISGYVEGVKCKSPNILYRLKRCIVDLYLPCLYFSLILWLPKFFISYFNIGNSENFKIASISDLFFIPFHGFDTFWFLSILFFVKLFHIFLEHFNVNKCFHPLFWISTFMINVFLGKQGPQFFYYLYFHIGVIMRRKNIISQENCPKVLCGIILCIAGISFFSASYFFGMSNILTKAGAALCTSLAMFTMFYALNIDKFFLVLCGVYSMVIYVPHNYVLASMRIIFRVLGLSAYVHPAILFLISCTAGLLLPLAVVWLYKNVRCLRWIEYIFYPGKLILKK